MGVSVPPTAPASSPKEPSAPLLQIWTGARNLLPTGRDLPQRSWNQRHLAISILLWAHVVIVPVFGLVRGQNAMHALLEGSIVAVFAMGAGVKRLPNDARAVLATLGLVSSSAILTHFSGGLIEMHFHFFVMVAVVTLYQSWLPFLAAIGYVLIHHGVAGALAPESVFNHPAAIAHPWRWAAIHALFISGESAACLTAWKLNEIARRDLQESETSFRLLFENNPLPMWVYDLETLSFLEVNDAAVEHYGFSREEFLAMKITDVRPAREVGRLLENLNEERAELTVGSQWQHRTKHGKLIDVEISSHTLAFDDHDAALVVVEDVTERNRAETERIRAEEELAHQAFHDPLTGLANRALFTDRVVHGLAQRGSVQSAVAVLFIDLDEFKAVNDTLGHAAGDDLLVGVADRLRHCVRPGDTIARLGGDEFAILLEENPGNLEAVAVAQRVLQALESPFHLNDKEVFVHGSAGIALGEVGKDAADDLLSKADTAMYHAKGTGKGRYEFFEAHMQAAIASRLKLTSELKHAVKRDEFFLQYQPIVELDTGGIVGVEALIRWSHPERGTVSPVEFIPIAESNGSICEIDHWVLANAARQAREWQTRFPHLDLRINVNLSARKLQQPQLVEEIKATLDEVGLHPRCLTLEITESLLLQHTESNITKLSELREMGIRLAIDDFGTGYSSLSYLRRFPVSVLKIDRSFIDRMSAGPEEAALANAVVKLGSTMNLQVVAEGVEGAEQVEKLRAMGCEYGQGYFFSRPLDPAAMEELLDQADLPWQRVMQVRTSA